MTFAGVGDFCASARLVSMNTKTETHQRLLMFVLVCPIAIEDNVEQRDRATQSLARSRTNGETRNISCGADPAERSRRGLRPRRILRTLQQKVVCVWVASA